MKKFFAVITTLLMFSALHAFDFSFGIEGAAGLNTMKIESDVNSDFDFIPGFSFGGTAQMSFNEVTALETKVLFHNGNGFSYIQASGKAKASFWTIDVPLLLKLTFAGIDTIPGRFTMFAGPTFNFHIGSVEESLGGIMKAYNSNSPELNPFVLGLEAGCEYSFSKENGFLAGLSVNCDLTNFASDTDVKANRISIMPYFGYKF